MCLVLIIDDDALVRSALCRILQRGGYEVIAASTGVEGLRLFAERRPRLVITDVIMPDKDGIETMREMRAAAPETPIIAVSGGGRIGNADLLRMARGLGADAILAKPFEPAQLLELVGRFTSPELAGGSDL